MSLLANYSRRFIYRLARLYWRVFEPLTLGSRALVIRDDQILLVRLSYAEGWHLPGGGVDREESHYEAVIRELKEECAIRAQSPKIFGLYYSSRAGKRDHIAIYEVREFEQLPNARPDPEIVEARFFDLKQLPQDLSTGTRRRIAEFRGETEISFEW